MRDKTARLRPARPIITGRDIDFRTVDVDLARCCQLVAPRVDLGKQTRLRRIPLSSNLCGLGHVASGLSTVVHCQLYCSLLHDVLLPDHFSACDLIIGYFGLLSLSLLRMDFVGEDRREGQRKLANLRSAVGCCCGRRPR